ncbi:MAG: YibE/F family protein [Actinomycetia bacterium]|nr:YibE/F family protein [Actinomycetes bacterium]
MGHSHSHDASAGPPLRGRTAAVLAAILVPCAVLTLVALVWLWPGSSAHRPDLGTAPTQANGDVLSVTRTACPPATPGDTPDGQTCGDVQVRLTSGKDSGHRIRTGIPFGPGAPQVSPGDSVVLVYLPDVDPASAYHIIDQQRSTSLWALMAAFALAVIAFGRWRGLSALAGLALTFAVLLVFIVPAILAGESPLLVAIAGSAAIMLSVLFLTHGINLPTAIAVMGTLVSLVLTGVLGALFSAAAHLTGVSSDDTTFVSTTFAGVNMQGLLLAGIVIGSLGVLDDVAVTQSVTVTELAAANPAYRFRELYRAATRVGRAHIASVINTIILAYAGASLPVLILIAAASQPLGQLLTSQQIAEELVRSGVGTLGLIAAVPVTTALAALAASRLPRATAPVDAATPAAPARTRGRHATSSEVR